MDVGALTRKKRLQEAEPLAYILGWANSVKMGQDKGVVGRAVNRGQVTRKIRVSLAGVLVVSLGLDALAPAIRRLPSSGAGRAPLRGVLRLAFRKKKEGQEFSFFHLLFFKCL